MFHLIAAVACVAAGTLFVTVFGITGITAERDYVSSHRGAGCVKGVVEVDGGQCGAIPWRFGCGKILLKHLSVEVSEGDIENVGSHAFKSIEHFRVLGMGRPRYCLNRFSRLAVSRCWR